MTTNYFEEEFDVSSPQQKKLYRGAYHYLKETNSYADETFEVFQDLKDLSLSFQSEINCRVATGEILKININYIVSKNYTPKAATIIKELGTEKVVEQFTNDKAKNILYYKFKNESKIYETNIKTPIKFHIITPAAVSSLLFILSKKFDFTSKNLYTGITSINQWNFDEELQVQKVVLEKTSLSSEALAIDGNEVQATRYLLSEKSKDSSKDTENNIEVLMSRYQSIPYILNSSDGTKIQIKYFNIIDN